MTHWRVQRQWRTSSDTVAATVRDKDQYTDEQIGALIMYHITNGWYVVRQDSISVTLRLDHRPSPSHQYIHCWREGF